MTRSTSPRLYQLRSMITTSPWREGAVCIVASTSVPPFPAVSLPSNTTQTFAAEAFTHACIATSSPCSRRNSRSCCFLFILACGSACAASAVAVWPSPSTSSRRLVFWPPRLPSARPRLGTPSQRHVLLHAVTGAQPTTHVSIYLRVNPWPTRHLPVSASYGREPDFEGPPRLLSSVRSGYRLGRWDAAGRNIGRSVGAGPVPNTPLHRPGRTHARLAPHHYGAMPWRVGIGRRR